MSLGLRFATGLACSALLWVTGCVGPMACGPGGACGPVAVNACGGCGDCDGCGELYIDPWINEPADCMDPCDTCGNHTGGSCGKCRSVFTGFASIWGYRRDAGCTSCGSMTCGGGCCAFGGGALGGGPSDCDSGSCGGGCDSGCQSCGGSGGEAVHISTDLMPPSQYVESTPARTYQPRRTRQIFQPRGNVAHGAREGVEY
ncbi:hypothetical protein K227x_16340 [Rubripirellula lacrimiformis]|uniref:Uncharacterized protein n=1 Tax=Rubripirellula lacrimiformis TaxID=1930273 RepID=A0A517N7Z9_9BACT|nr:hypothetical protein [Rubripirellula lacrimiformis]QDT03252.1 hypothetical protein K227x_16340 [Rubripirellula lacrimiformis]